MASDDIKALLLEDYKHCAAGMARSEQAGETRLTFFIGLVTFCAGAVGAGYAKDSQIFGRMHEVALGVALALLAIGIVILLRMITRNEKTDLAKAQLDLIRQTFADRFDETQMLARYDLFPQSGGRKLGGLTDLVAAVNGILLVGVGIFTFLILKHSIDSNAVVVLVSAALILFVAQREYVRASVKKYKDKLTDHFLRFTHAGGVVYTVENGKVSYLLVRPKEIKSGKDEWVLPQGHIEPREGPGPRESHGDAALREVYEEAGVVAQLRGVVGSEQFRKGNGLQIVKFFLMEKTANATAEEDRQPQWFSLADALDNFEKLNYRESMRTLRSAERLRLQAVSSLVGRGKISEVAATSPLHT